MDVDDAQRLEQQCPAAQNNAAYPRSGQPSNVNTSIQGLDQVQMHPDQLGTQHSAQELLSLLEAVGAQRAADTNVLDTVAVQAEQPAPAARSAAEASTTIAVLHSLPTEDATCNLPNLAMRHTMSALTSGAMPSH